jgi:hypothetical protein
MHLTLLVCSYWKEAYERCSRKCTASQPATKKLPGLDTGMQTLISAAAHRNTRHNEDNAQHEAYDKHCAQLLVASAIYVDKMCHPQGC